MKDDGGDKRTYAIIGAAMEVHRVLGAGFLEAVYQQALAVELEIRGIPFAREVPVSITYKNRVLSAVYRADFLCFDSVSVELKALMRPSGMEDAQIIHYLMACNKEVGLLINFAAPRLEYRRFTNFDCKITPSVASVTSVADSSL
jgi:GxxExxY protein